MYTVRPVNKGHPKETEYMVFMDKWPLFGGYIVSFNQRRVTELWPSFTGWPLLEDGLKNRFLTVLLEYIVAYTARRT